MGSKRNMNMKEYEDRQAKAWQRYRNRQSNGFGKNFERFISIGCDYYRENGIADICKVDEPFRVIKLKGGGRFEGQFTRNANPDFEGTLKGGGSICFEAKYTSSNLIKKSVITEKQEEVLNFKHGLGAYVGVCVGIKERYFFVPWEIWSNMKEIYGRVSVGVEELKRYEVVFRKGVMFLDFKRCR